MLQLTQTSVEPSTVQNERRKAGPDKYFPTELPGAASKEVAANPKLVGEQQTPTEPQALAIETTAPTTEDMPLVLVVEPQALAWAQHTVRFPQTRELPEEQEDAEKVARRYNMY